MIESNQAKSIGLHCKSDPVCLGCAAWKMNDFIYDGNCTKRVRSVKFKKKIGIATRKNLINLEVGYEGRSELERRKNKRKPSIPV